MDKPKNYVQCSCDSNPIPRLSFKLVHSCKNESGSNERGDAKKSTAMHYRLPGPFNEASYVLRMLPDAFSRIDERVKHCQLPVHTVSYSSSSSSSSPRVIVHPPRTEATRFWSIARGGFLNRSELVEERWYSCILCILPICIVPMHERLLARWLFRSVQRSQRFLDRLQVLARLMVIENGRFPLIAFLFRARLDRSMVRKKIREWWIIVMILRKNYIRQIIKWNIFKCCELCSELEMIRYEPVG